MRQIILLCSILIFADCSAEEKSFFTYMNPIKSRYNIDVRQRRGFEYLGGGGGGCYEFRRAALTFNANITASIADARCIIVEEALRLLEMLNADRMLRLYMHDFPVDSRNLEYFIGFKNQNCLPSGDLTLGSVHLKDGQIVYISPGTDASIWRVLLHESFQEAVEKLRQAGWKN